MAGLNDKKMFQVSMDRPNINKSTNPFWQCSTKSVRTKNKVSSLKLVFVVYILSTDP